MKGIRKHTISIKNAVNGIYWAAGNHPNFRIHILATVIILIAGFVFGISALEWVLITLVIGFVFTAELFNSSIEALSDKVADGKYHELIKITKDVSAGGVLMAALISVIAGFLVFAPYILGSF